MKIKSAISVQFTARVYRSFTNFWFRELISKSRRIRKFLEWVVYLQHPVVTNPVENPARWQNGRSFKVRSSNCQESTSKSVSWHCALCSLFHREKFKWKFCFRNLSAISVQVRRSKLFSERYHSHVSISLFSLQHTLLHWFQWSKCRIRYWRILFRFFSSTEKNLTDSLFESIPY